jgi:hypothetical protein
VAPALDCSVSALTVSSPVHVGHETPRRFVSPVPALIVIGPVVTLTAANIRSVVPGVIQGAVNGGVVISAPRLTPSTANWTPATPTLSVAVALTVAVPEIVVPAVGVVIATVGTVASSGVTVTSAETARLPAASRDRTRMIERPVGQPGRLIV